MIVSFYRKHKKTEELREEIWKMDERIDGLQRRLNSMAELLAVAFDAEGYTAYRVIKNEKPKVD